MRLQPDSLPLQLKKKFLSVTVLYGNESFLIEESVKAISQAFEAQFSGEQETISIENTASWQKLEEKILNRSLFSENRLMIIQLFQTKIQAKESAILETILTNQDPHLFFIFHFNALTRAQQNAKWFSVADQKGAIVAHWPLTQAAFSHWLKAKLALKGISPTPSLLSELLYYTEGNCLAAHQEIERLALLSSNDNQVELPHLQNQFSVFDLMDAALQQKPERVLHILHALKQSGTALPLLIWSFVQTFRLLMVCETEKDENKKLNLLQKAAIRSSLQPFYIKRAKLEPSISGLYSHLYELDLGIKSGKISDGWSEITSIGLKLAGITNFGVKI